MKNKPCSKCQKETSLSYHCWCRECFKQYRFTYNLGFRTRKKITQKARKWTQEEIKFLEQATYFCINDRIIAEDLKRSIGSILNKRSDLKIKKDFKDFPIRYKLRTTQGHFGELFRKMLTDSPVSEIAAKANITLHAIYGACSKNCNMTLSKKAIRRVAEVMELNEEVTQSLIAAHELDKQELGKIWTK